ncbi:UvrD-helicase domain-containing protein [Pareuzebyella sediminis]|uniref:UvrD-helicase domain-containing protein n=1 Tax=Pareuzebyella sediminis TaxID=2607998 RepID=UPI001E5BAD0C|nr:UvrD-helicase domain-containing protein [Pareuzebyella sediminis]
MLRTLIESVFCIKKHLQEAPFKIYNASAGSGKTHTLTKEYLKIVLSSQNQFKKILAITFTNKAVNEMKSRILKTLFEFGKVSDFSTAPLLFDEIAEELHLEHETLKLRAKRTLKAILHNYAFFDISTIDKFTHRLIRTFARDLQLPQNFEVVLDTDLLLEEAVARLVEKAGSDKKLTQVLIDFALEKIDDDKSWDITYDLTNFGRLLFRENDFPHLEKLKDKNIDDFITLKDILAKRIEAKKQNLVSVAQQILNKIAEKGLVFSDFKAGYFPKFMAKIAQKDLNINFNAAWKQNFVNTGLYTKSTSENIKLELDLLFPIFSKALETIRQDFYQLSLLKNVYGNLVPLTVLNAIQQEVKALLSERDQLSISEFNGIISKEVSNQPAPFIYERLGEKYRHYFIDEFQDTSSMQWNNLVPLVANALESEDLQGKRGSLFLVGDAKQAIYRWRGGRAEQFLNLITKDANPFVVVPETRSLPKNFRSHEEIIKFNNEFFRITSPLLNDSRYSSLFVDGSNQGYNEKKGGVVQLSFIEGSEREDRDEQYCHEALRIIKSVSKRNYGYDDICILVRGNKEGVLLAEYLTQNQIPTISSESLLLKSSDKVGFLVSILEYAINPQPEKGYEILYYLSLNIENQHQFIFENLNGVEKYLIDAYELSLDTVRRSSVYDTAEEMIKKFNLVPDSDAYITYFMDFILEVEQREGVAIQVFLSHWDKKKDRLGITAPDTIDAVRIMTIHKSKGLEFPIVIFPFANEHIYRGKDKKMWLPVDPNDFNGFDEILLNEKKEVLEYGQIAAELYAEEEYKMELDAFNLLYVALTRAEKALFVISEKDLTSNGEHKKEFYSGLFIEYLKEKKLWNQNETVYTMGHLMSNKEVVTKRQHETVHFGYTYKHRSEFKILTKAGMLWDTARGKALSKGNLLHYVLGLVETEGDIEDALNIVVRRGDILEEDINEIKNAVDKIVNHPDLHKYFEEGNIIRNEADMVTKEGNVIRPDRIIFRQGQVSLIDYKTGKSDPKYVHQLYTYSDALIEMGYKVEQRILVYINDNVSVKYV